MKSIKLFIVLQLICACRLSAQKHDTLPHAMGKTSYTSISVEKAVSSIKAFYQSYIRRSSAQPSQSVDTLNAYYLTPALIERLDRLIYSTDADPILRAQDISDNMLSSLNVRPLGGNWFMVSYIWSKESGHRQDIPVRVKAYQDRYQIDYVTPAWNGAQYGDSLLLHSSVAVVDNATPQAFLKSFYNIYTSAYCDMPEHLAGRLSMLRKVYMTDQARQQYRMAEEVEKQDGYIGYDQLIDNFDFDATWQPSITVEHADGDTYIVRYSGNGGSKSRRIEVVKSGKGYLINAISPNEKPDETAR
ncbi:MAG: YbjP/YqhG family protein [Mediterranea sp.]|jgi:hypothetical protein|nr:YbjP/YqhG family protein [Mediterranea sp.]